MTIREPEFDEDDRAWLLGLAYWRDTRCPSCGGDIRDCTAPEDEITVTVPPPRRCKATDALLDERQRYKDSPKPGALLFRAEVRRQRG